MVKSLSLVVGADQERRRTKKDDRESPPENIEAPSKCSAGTCLHAPVRTREYGGPLSNLIPHVSLNENSLSYK